MDVLGVVPLNNRKEEGGEGIHLEGGAVRTCGEGEQKENKRGRGSVYGRGKRVRTLGGGKWELLVSSAI